MIAFSAALFDGRPESGAFTDAGAVAAGLGKYAGRTAGVLFAVALIDACIIGAAAVSLSTAYAIGDVLSLKHSLHRKAADAKGFYGVYCGLVAIAVALVLTPGTPLGLLTSAVQTLAGVLLPSATVFLLLLCNDREVLGPWVNSRRLNLFTGIVIAALVMLSIILTASVLFPDIDAKQIFGILAIGGAIALALSLVLLLKDDMPAAGPVDRSHRESWLMPPLHRLAPARLTPLAKGWMGILRLYLLVAGGMVLFRIVELAVAGRG